MGRNGKIRRAPGFEDRVGSNFERIASAIRNSRELLYSHGYQPIETPLIEQTELFLRRSGGLLSSQLFDFTAPDGSEISLRPELTAPVIRHALEQDREPLPWRYQYASPIFRYTERPYDAPPSSVPSKRQFIQVGAELIGSSHASADGEIIAAAYALARQLGVENVAIRIGHVGLIREVLEQFNLSERARWFLANRVTTFRDGDGSATAVEKEAMRLGLMPSNGKEGVEAQASAADLLTRLASGSVQLPSDSDAVARTAEEVVGGLRRKLESDVSNADFLRAMALMREIASISSDAVESQQKPIQERPSSTYGTTTISHSDTIFKAEEVLANYGAVVSSCVDNLGAVVDAAQSGGVDKLDIFVDFGLATSMAYYSGMIFEVCAYRDGEIVQIGGGGRYDGLASSLGSPADLPALGFALNLDTILELVSDSAATQPQRRYILLVPYDDCAVDMVLEAASDLRTKGHSVVSLFEPEVDAQSVAETVGTADVVTVKAVGKDLTTYELVSG